ncbi:hypothetical protein M0R45_008578 [Rubus argutus]|uniref:hAT-like transposase RNase-H fold domain-containing protein n=2 Tax=Rubus argutus TaxID=59490 RepID=A0AAW1Y2J5_RUBAR
MVLTAHFIDYRWNIHKRIVNFCIIPNHRGITIGKILEICLIQWKIDKVLTVSVDNATANKGAIDYLRKKMVNWTTPSVVLGGKHLHVRCLAHILNLIVRSGLNIMDKSVASIRNAVKYVRSSPSRLDDFKLCVAKVRLECKKVCVLDVPTRWNSTFLMLETALELRRAFERMTEEEEQQYYGYFNEDEDEDEIEEDEENLEGIKIIKPRKRIGPPNEADWDMAAIFVKFLRVFYDVTMRISASTKPTAQSAFHDIVAIDAEISGLFGMPEMSNGSENEKILVQMAVKMRSKFKKYFGTIDDLNQLLLVALVLDPRYKMRNFKHVCQRMLAFDDQQVKEKSSQLKDLLVALAGLYASSAGSQNTQRSRGNNGGNSSRTSSSKAKSTSVGGKMAEMLDDWERELEDSCEVVVESEVDRYLLDPIEKPPREANFVFYCGGSLMELSILTCKLLQGTF